MNYNFKNKVALITGGTTGLGLKLVQNFLNCNASVVFCSRNPKKVEEIEKKLSAKLQKKHILEFRTKDPTKNPLMGWESSSDTYTELKLEFSSKELAINYAKKKKIDFELIEPRKRKTVKKSYADNFLK